MISPFFMLSFKYNFFFFSVLILFFSNISGTSSQEIDVDSLLDRLKRIEKNHLFWEPTSENKETYMNIINEEIVYLSRFIYEQAKLLMNEAIL